MKANRLIAEISNPRIQTFAPGYADDRERIISLCPFGRVGESLAGTDLKITDVTVKRIKGLWSWVVCFTVPNP